MQWSYHFTEVRTARRYHSCTGCRSDIGPGDTYKRSAIPPWGWEDIDERGEFARYSVGHWTVTKRCYACVDDWQARAA